MRRRGISSVVATVLIILITIAAVTIVWNFVLPATKQLSDSKINQKTQVSIVISTGYTVYDPAQHFAFVQVERGVDEENVQKLNFIFTIDGNSVVYETPDAPETNQKRTYSFNFSRDKILGTPEFVSVAPVFGVNGGEKVGEITSKVKIPIKSATISEQDNENSKGNMRIDGGGGDAQDILLIECGTLDEEGKTYVLQNDIFNHSTCFTIGADSVILDLNGFNVTGDDSGLDYGVYVNGYNYTTIKNGEIYDFYEGIYLKNNQNNNLTNMTTNSNGNHGIFLYSSSNNTLEDNTENSNTNAGIYLWLGSNNNILTNITANSNENGIYLDLSSNNTLTTITANSNGDYGVYLYLSSNNTLTTITADSNYEGIELSSNSNNNILTNITANSNGAGIYLYLSSNNTIQSSTFNSNDWYGIYLTSSSNNNKINLASACGNIEKDFYCFESTGNFGISNNFGAGNIFSCSDGWPTVIDYTPCS